MNIYHRTELGKLYKNDTIEVMKTLPDNSVDIIITDPPYGVIGTSDGYNQEWDTFESESHFWEFTTEWLNQCYRIMKDGAPMYIFFAQKRMFDLKNVLDKCNFTFKRMLIWHHPNLARPTRNMYIWTYDPIFYVIKGKKPNYFDASFTQKENVDVFRYAKPQNWRNGKKRLHPCEKPLELIKILITNSSQMGDMVVDPFGGSGTTAIASEELGRRWITMELDEEYCETIKTRFSSKHPQMRLDEC
jgi:site-specific DNA-methyltransferase (adenine-specific)